MIVAGTVHGNTLDALAYKNLTTGIDGHQSCILWLVVGVVVDASLELTTSDG